MSSVSKHCIYSIFHQRLNNWEMREMSRTSLFTYNCSFDYLRQYGIKVFFYSICLVADSLIWFTHTTLCWPSYTILRS